MSPFEEWSNYVHSCISGTHGVKVTPFWAGSEALISGGQCGQQLRNEIELSNITYNNANFAGSDYRGFFAVDTF